MRRTVLPVTLLCAMWAGCTGGPATDTGEPPPSPESSAPSSPGTLDAAQSTSAALPDTYAGVAEPATVRVPLAVLDGIEDVRFWKGSTIEEGPTQVFGDLTRKDGEEELVAVFSRAQPLAKESSEAEIRYWSKNNSFTEGRATVVDPVVVDGIEMLRAQGSNSFAEIDYFVHATGELSVGVLFVMPKAMSDAEREDRIGQVMTTLRLE